MEFKHNTMDVCLLAFLLFGVVCATTQISRDAVTEEVLMRVNRLETRADDQQREISKLHAQVLPHANGALSLQSILRRVDSKESRENGTLPSGQMAATGMNDRERIHQVKVGTPITFFAMLAHHQTDAAVNDTVIFNDVVTNIGNAYNPHTGTFIAPVQGTYALSVTLTTLNVHVPRYNITVDGQTVSHVYVRGGDRPFESSSQTAVLQLASGDHVTVRTRSSDKSLIGNHSFTFAGFLIYQ